MQQAASAMRGGRGGGAMVGERPRRKRTPRLRGTADGRCTALVAAQSAAQSVAQTAAQTAAQSAAQLAAEPAALRSTCLEGEGGGESAAGRRRATDVHGTGAASRALPRSRGGPRSSRAHA
jgi:hypothetical protein